MIHRLVTISMLPKLRLLNSYAFHMERVRIILLAINAPSNLAAFSVSDFTGYCKIHFGDIHLMINSLRAEVILSFD